MESEKIESSQLEVAGDESGMEVTRGEQTPPAPGKQQALRLDKAGLPLVPQPTSHKDDPLVPIPL